jgi:uncharacterized protein with PQ loop repeat
MWMCDGIVVIMYSPQMIKVLRSKCFEVNCT